MFCLFVCFWENGKSVVIEAESTRSCHFVEVC